MLRLCCAVSFVLLVSILPEEVAAQAAGASVPPGFESDNGPRPVDYGPGPGVSLEEATTAEIAVTAAEAAPPLGSGASTKGVFGPAATWPLIPIHAVLLPDGRVLSYGTDGNGQQSGQFIYDVWNPRQGTGSGSHLVLPNTTGTDIFCSGQSVIPGSGNVLLTGGDITINGVRNYSDDATTIFYPKSTSSPTQALRPHQSMAYKRWYPSIVPLANGDKLIVGGRAAPNAFAPTPEVFSASTGWRLLTSASSDVVFGSGIAWWYPRAYQMPNSAAKVFVLGHTGKMFYLTSAGSGTITQLAKTTLAAGYALPTVAFAQGKLLSLRYNSKAIVIDINGAQPVITPTADIDQVRYWSNATVMADGKVVITGGSSAINQLSGVAYASQIWDPATGRWTLGAKAGKPRLYHSTALLLSDGSVLTGGGGANGPVKNLNAEIFYPPYLYKGARPTLSGAPAVLSLGQTKSFKATVGAGNVIVRLTLLHTGSTTHSIDLEQNFQTLSFTQSGQTLTVQSPANRNYTLPGYYMLFAFAQNGAPSEAKVIKITR
jgi:hypothetical protein